jgi:hypothetical protein
LHEGLPRARIARRRRGRGPGVTRRLRHRGARPLDLRRADVATWATFEEDSDVDYGGKLGFDLHGQLGALWLPLIALAFLVVAFVTRRSVEHGLRFAGIVLGLMVLQAVLGFATLAVPGLAALHAVNALALFTTAAYAATRLSPAPRTTSSSGAALAELAG